jgi:glucan phosphoethanolaminetransferase (alkaline phosphatase superfamily)
VRASQLVTQYIQAALFAGLGLRAVAGWLRNRELRQAHLALATGLFGAQQLVSAINTTLYDAALGETPPRALTILTSVLIFSSVYAFVLFLSDFVAFPRFLHGVAILATLFVIVMSFIERPDLRFDPNRGVVHISGVTNPISYRTWISFLLIYLAIAFGVLAAAFAVFGGRQRGLARLRMLLVGGGFFLLFVAIGLVPRLLFGNPSAATIRNLLNVVRYMALGSAPLLFLGFTPPRWLSSRAGGAAEAEP